MDYNFKYAYYFFDFFGTIMNRKCSADDIKRIWSNRLSLRLNSVLTSKTLYEVRIAAEKYISQNSLNYEFLYENLTKEIYQRLLRLTEIGLSENEFVSLCYEIEIKVESENQSCNEILIKRIYELKSRGKKVYIISDFYLGAKELQFFLEKKDVFNLVDGIFVSCEMGTNKANGELYSVVLDKLGVSAETCCMIGDNYKSDYLNAKQYGLNAYKVKEDKQYNRCIDVEKKLNEKINLDKKNGLSYSNYSFVLFRFISLLYEELIKNKEKRVFFFSREGELLKKLFDIYCNIINQKLGMPIIESRYLFVSRQATYPASLKQIEDEDFRLLLHQYPDISINSFLTNIGFSREGKKELEESIELHFEDVIINFATSKEYEKLVHDNMFIEKYSQVVKNNRNSLQLYLEQNDFLDGKSVAIVDVGWKGTIQDCIVKALGEKIVVKGYYYGLRNDAKCTDTNIKKGLIFEEYPYNSQDLKVWSFDANFMERLLSASHASTQGYKLVEQHMDPVLNEFGSEKENYEVIRPIQECLINQFSNIVSSIYDLPVLEDELYEVLKKIHLKTCCHVYKSNMVLQTQLLNGQMENFGFQVKSGDRLKHVFTLRNIIKKLKKNVRLLKNITLMTKVLNSKKLYGLSVLLYRLTGVCLRKEL